jgi:hypothetical protein
LSIELAGNRFSFAFSSKLHGPLEAAWTAWPQRHQSRRTSPSGIERRMLTPCLRQSLAVDNPASCSRNTALICSSVNLDRSSSRPCLRPDSSFSRRTTSKLRQLRRPEVRYVPNSGKRTCRFLQRSRRITNVDRPGLKIAKSTAPRTKYCPVADTNPWADKRLSSNPRPKAYDNR